MGGRAIVELNDILGSLFSAVAASLAALAVTFRLEASRRRAPARTDLLLAIRRDCERLEKYAGVFQKAEVFARKSFWARGFQECQKTLHPVAQLLAAGSSVRDGASITLHQTRNRVQDAAVDEPQSRESIADRQASSDTLQHSFRSGTDARQRCRHQMSEELPPCSRNSAWVLDAETTRPQFAQSPYESRLGMVLGRCPQAEKRPDRKSVV